MLYTYIEVIPSGILQGLILAIIVLGVAIPFKLLDFPDLTAEGSYPLGGAICASMLVYEFNPFVAILTACMCGGVIGIITALIHLKYKIDTLLAGIIVSTMVYSVNLRIMGKPNISLFEYQNIFSSFSNDIFSKSMLLLILNILIIVALYLFLLTEKGLRFRAVGLNKSCSEKQSINLNLNILFGLFVGNACCALAGAIIIQTQNYADINIGVGIIIHALAAMMIGERIINNNNILGIICAPIIGSLIYQQIQGIVLSAGLNPANLKFMTGIIILLLIASKTQRT